MSNIRSAVLGTASIANNIPAVLFTTPAGDTAICDLWTVHSYTGNVIQTYLQLNDPVGGSWLLDSILTTSAQSVWAHTNRIVVPAGWQLAVWMVTTGTQLCRTTLHGFKAVGVPAW